MDRMRCGHLWVEFISGSRLCSKGFFYRCTSFPCLSKSAIPHSNSIRNVVKEEPGHIPAVSEVWCTKN